MPILNILWPTFALVGLIFTVWIVLAAARLRHMRRTPPTRDTFATGSSALGYFEPVEMPANNLRNLFEVPVLYFALVPLLILTRHADHVQVILAWLYVALRLAHSVVHIRHRNVALRAQLFMASTAVLLVMWTGFFIDMVVAADTYHAALAGMPQP